MASEDVFISREDQSNSLVVKVENWMSSVSIRRPSWETDADRRFVPGPKALVEAIIGLRPARKLTAHDEGLSLVADETTESDAESRGSQYAENRALTEQNTERSECWYHALKLLGSKGMEKEDRERFLRGKEPTVPASAADDLTRLIEAVVCAHDFMDFYYTLLLASSRKQGQEGSKFGGIFSQGDDVRSCLQEASSLLDGRPREDTQQILDLVYSLFSEPTAKTVKNIKKKLDSWKPRSDEPKIKGWSAVWSGIRR